MPNLENFLTFEHWQFELIRHLFLLTSAVFAAGLVYFLLSSRNVAPKYKASSFLSAVVMTSATAELFFLWQSFNSTFAFTGAVWIPVEGRLFSNGYRYANWCIDVPMLLTQLLIVAGITGKAFWSKWSQFTIAGLLMIFTGYIGQFYEPQVAGIVDGDASPFWIWGFVSTLFFVWIAALSMLVTQRPSSNMPLQAQKEMKQIGWLLLVSWTLYAFGYGWPAWQGTEDGMVIRQVLYTVADISSKLVYGVLLSRVALIQSAHDGFAPALRAGGDRALTESERRRAIEKMPASAAATA
jgi:bacteriorhodopsin